MTYYLTIFEQHPWPKNFQHEIDCASEKEAHKIAGILSAINAVPVRVSTKPGFRHSHDFIYGTFTMKDRLRKYTYKIIEL